MHFHNVKCSWTWKNAFAATTFFVVGALSPSRHGSTNLYLFLYFYLLLVLSSCHGSTNFVMFRLNASERQQECVFTLNFLAFSPNYSFCFAVFLVCSLVFHPVSKQCQLCVIKRSTHTPHGFISQRASVQMCLNTFGSFDLIVAWQFCPHTPYI